MNKPPIIPSTIEELTEKIWQRYGNFELSHIKNEGVVKNILEFILDERREYAQFHVREALKKASKIPLEESDSYGLDGDGNDYMVTYSYVDEEGILNCYPDENIK